MTQRPSAIALMLCDQVVFEEGTQKPYLLGVFTGKAVDKFPSGPQRFDIFAALTDGLGDVIITVTAVQLDTNEVIYQQRCTISFPDPLQVVNLRFRVRELQFLAPGMHLIALMVGDQEIAGRRLRVYQAGGSP
jgi:hypothetical protein